MFLCSTLELGNCDIHEKQKILFANEMKRYKIWLRLKGWVQKIFRTLLSNFIQFRYFLLSLSKFMILFGKILVSFKLFQISEILDLAMAQNKKLNIAVT